MHFNLQAAVAYFVRNHNDDLTWSWEGKTVSGTSSMVTGVGAVSLGRDSLAQLVFSETRGENDRAKQTLSIPYFWSPKVISQTPDISVTFSAEALSPFLSWPTSGSPEVLPMTCGSSLWILCVPDLTPPTIRPL